MPRVRARSAPETVKETLHETLQFDTDSNGQALAGSQRTAHTEGKMFGLTFWENWYLIGQNDNAEKDFRFVYYTGKTLQNRYEGAFVYARQPEIPKDALPHIYSIAREAGMEPTGMCCIDNKCFADPASAEKAPTAPLFTPVAVAETPLEAAAAPQKRPSAPRRPPVGDHRPAGVHGGPAPLRARALRQAEDDGADQGVRRRRLPRRHQVSGACGGEARPASISLYFRRPTPHH